MYCAGCEAAVLSAGDPADTGSGDRQPSDCNHSTGENHPLAGGMLCERCEAGPHHAKHACPGRGGDDRHLRQ